MSIDEKQGRKSSAWRITGDDEWRFGAESRPSKEVKPMEETMAQVFSRMQQTYELIAEFFDEELIEEEEE